jgi:hypothetical protein
MLKRRNKLLYCWNWDMKDLLKSIDFEGVERDR